MNGKLLIVLIFALCCSAKGEGQRDYIGEMMNITNEAHRIAYVRSLTENEVWLMASQGFDKGWDSFAAGAILGAYFGENWERNPPSMNVVENVIRDKKFNPKLRGALAASGFEISRAWEFNDRLRYFDSVAALLRENDVPAVDKARMAEYSQFAFKRCLSETRSLSDTNVMKSVHLNACHARAQVMMKTLSSTIEGNPKEQAEGAMAKALEDYARIYEHEDFPKSPQFQGAVDEAAKSRAVLRQYRER